MRNNNLLFEEALTTLRRKGGQIGRSSWTATDYLTLEDGTGLIKASFIATIPLDAYSFNDWYWDALEVKATITFSDFSNAWDKIAGEMNLLDDPRFVTFKDLLSKKLKLVEKK